MIGYSYDDFGRRTQTAIYAAGADPQVATPDRTTDFTYDALGRLESVTEDRDASITTDALLDTLYTYDLIGNLDLTLLPNGVAEDYVYDNLNRLDTLTHYQTDGTIEDTYDFSDDNKIAEFDYDVRADGRRVNLNESFFDGSGNLLNTNTYAWDYDNLNRLVTEEFTSTDTNISDYTTDYTFDLTGNRLTKASDLDGDTIADETVTYAYDANDRLTREFLDKVGTTDDTTTFYGYDVTQQASKAVYAGDHASEPVGTQSPLSKQTFGYDLQGRMDFVRTETRDGAGNLTRVEEVTYDYDASGIRVSAEQKIDADVNGGFETIETTIYLVDHQNFTGYQQVVREVVTDALQSVIKQVEYAFGLDEIAQTVTESGQSRTDFFAHDGHGSVRMLLDELMAVQTINSIEQLFTFDAYGNLLNIDPINAATSLLYSGEQFDVRIGQQYLRARYYDAGSGRFNRLDPFFGNKPDPQSFHKYLYAHGEPIWFVDPTGQFSLIGSISANTLAVSISQEQFSAGVDIVELVMPANEAIQVYRKLEQAAFWTGAAYLVVRGAFSGAKLLTNTAAGKSFKKWVRQNVRSFSARFADYSNRITRLLSPGKTRRFPTFPGGTNSRYDPKMGQGIYVLRDKEKLIRYVGRGDAPERIKVHGNAGSGLEDLDAEILFDNNLPSDEAVSLEHALIHALGGPLSVNPETQLRNKRQALGEGNPFFVPVEFAADDELFIEALRRAGLL